MAFDSYTAVDNWLAMPGRTVEVLRAQAQSGEMIGENAHWANAWLTKYDGLAAPAQAERELRLLERSQGVVKSQARLSRTVIVVAIAAVVIAMWPLLSHLWK